MLAFSLVAGACSGGGDDEAAPENTVAVTESTSSTSSTSTTTTTAPPATTAPAAHDGSADEDESSTTTPQTAQNAVEEPALLEAIERFAGNIWAVSDPPDSDPERWDGIVGEEYALELAGRTADRAAEGVGLRALNPDGPFIAAHEVQFVIGDEAEVRVCLFDQGSSYDLESGATIRTLELLSVSRVSLVRQGDGWIVALSRTIGDFPIDQVDECGASL